MPRFVPVAPLAREQRSEGSTPQGPRQPSKQFVSVNRPPAVPLPDLGAFNLSRQLGQGAAVAGLGALGSGYANRLSGGHPLLSTLAPSLGLVSGGLGLGAIAANTALPTTNKVLSGLSIGTGMARNVGALPGIPASVSGALNTPLGHIIPGLGPTLADIPALGALGTGFTIANTALSDMPDEQKAVNSAIDVGALALAAPTYGASTVVAPVLKAFLGQTFKRAVPHGVREALETSKALHAAKGLAHSVLETGSLDDLYTMLVHNTSGSLGGGSSLAIGTQFGYPTDSGGPGVLPHDLIVDMLAKGQILPRARLTSDQAIMESQTPAVGKQRGELNVSTVTPEGFARLMREHPELLIVSTQAGVTPGKLGPGNRAVADAIRAQATRLNLLGPLYQKAQKEVSDVSFIEFVDSLNAVSLDTASLDTLVNTIQAARRKKAQEQRESETIQATDPMAFSGGVVG